MVATVRFGVVVTVWLAVVFAGRALAQGSGCVDTLTYNLKESSDLKFFSSAVSETGLDLNLQVGLARNSFVWLRCLLLILPLFYLCSLPGTWSLLGLRPIGCLLRGSAVGRL